MIPTTSKIVWPTTTASLCELLEVDTDVKKCHALTKKNARCKNNISQANSTLITCLLKKVIVHGSFSAAQTALEEVSDLIMCRHRHRQDGPLRLAQWAEILKPLEVVLIKKEDTKDTLKPDEEIVNASPTTPVMSFQQQVQPKSETPKPTTTSRRRSQSSPSTPSKSSPKLLLPKLHSPKSPKSAHEFEDFSHPRSTLETNKAMKKLLLRSLQEEETKHGGYIYLYTYSESYHDAHPYIKIGFAQDVGRRMREWKYQCGYEAKVLGEFLAEHYVKVEKIVHAQLWNQRKREKGCPACNIRHKEWFKVDAMTASKIIALWTGWMRQEPYDEEGNILDKWRVRIEGLDMADPDCWDLLIKGLFDGDVEESELSEEGDSFAWSSDEQSNISEEDALEDYDTNKSEISLTDDESDDEVSVGDDDE
ncbi:meiotically up-regulated gene 113-domain-containing protein [Fusarium redolens]|uniref:Meiotically up-regulated gene 113-domain-containing protein n=1 Tax=Fusarium redolens TaxID=48865 RepID=A0A9P9KFZ7_FUSRE|nr:meiotically up-regulated gene 113-domain-containing protein [Fusarium redolens]KAH7255780.1 meiotically up-regulated gene 113-domain-containing protein [Fusarium redolens]